VQGACKDRVVNLIIRERLRFTETKSSEVNDEVLDFQEGLVEFRNNELLCGSLGKVREVFCVIFKEKHGFFRAELTPLSSQNSLGGSKTSVFFAILRDVSDEVNFLFSLPFVLLVCNSKSAKKNMFG